MLQGYLPMALTLAILAIGAPLLGLHMAKVYLGRPTVLDRIAQPVEALIFAASGLPTLKPMSGGQYLRAVLVSNGVMGLAVFALLMAQGLLPLNPTQRLAPTWDLALHTAVSFLTNTDQQHYSGETALSYLSQVGGLGFLMFTSAATGLAVAMAFVRGLSGRPLGNFYKDLTLSITRILLPLSLVVALLLLLAGVPETLSGPVQVTTLEGATQTLALGPVAHFESIKQIGENGGGFFGINSAHPFENPSNWTNLIETVAMMIIPAGLIITYGVVIDNPKQGWLLFGMVFILLITLTSVAAIGEYLGNPLVNPLLASPQPNLEGKEVRFGWLMTSLWAVATTGTMCGAVNGMHDSLMPAGGFVTLTNLFIQVVLGGQGTGTAYLFTFLILTVFLTGLMVGRTPEFLGRKIEKREIVLGSLLLLIHPIAILIPGAITLAFPEALGGISNPGFHGISQVIYEYASAAANNGSGFEGLGDNTLWWNLSASVSMAAGRYIPVAALLFLAEGMTRKQPVPETTGTLRTDTRLFTTITAFALLILGALTFFPILILGPVAEAFQLAQ